MSVTDMKVTRNVSDCHRYDRGMGRWEPDARGRLAQAALKLYVEQGFEPTTVVQIARSAGLTERTFFRHFTDKREVLFHGSETTQSFLALGVAQAPATASAMDAVGSALEAMAAQFQEDPERVRLRNSVVSVNPDLRERELIKLAGMATALAEALRERGVPEPDASLAAEAGIAGFKVAFAGWVDHPERGGLPEILRSTMVDLRNLLIADRRDEPRR
jgi:AcrR family transcriptional regulator